MKLTKIYFRQYSRILLMAFAAIGGAAVATAVTTEDKPKQDPLANIDGPITAEKLNALPGVSITMNEASEAEQHPEPDPEPIRLAERQKEKADPLAQWRGAELTGVATDADGNPIYARIETKDGGTYSLDTIRAEGFNVRMPDQCSVIISDQETGEMIRLHTSYCPELG